MLSYVRVAQPARQLPPPLCRIPTPPAPSASLHTPCPYRCTRVPNPTRTSWPPPWYRFASHRRLGTARGVASRPGQHGSEGKGRVQEAWGAWGALQLLPREQQPLRRADDDAATTTTTTVSRALFVGYDRPYEHAERGGCRAEAAGMHCIPTCILHEIVKAICIK